MIPERKKLNSTSAIRSRIVGFQTFRDAREIIFCLFAGDSGLEQCKSFDPVRAAVLQLVSVRLKGLLHGNGHPELNETADEGSVKAFRCDADNSMWDAIQQLRFANNVFVAMETFFP